MNLQIYLANAHDAGWPESPAYVIDRMPVPRKGERLLLTDADGTTRDGHVIEVVWHYPPPSTAYVPFVHVLVYRDEDFTPLPRTVAVDEQSIRELLSALEDAIDYRRDQGESCAGCDEVEGEGKCPDHGTDDDIASMYEMLHDDLARRLGEDVAADEPEDGGRG